MKQRGYTVKVVATWFVVSALLAVGLFWSRWLIGLSIANSAYSENAPSIRIPLDEWVPQDICDDPCYVVSAEVIGSTDLQRFPVENLGFSNWYREKEAVTFRYGQTLIFRTWPKADSRWEAGYDSSKNLIVCQWFPGNKETKQGVFPGILFIGPKGVSEKATGELGQFINPVFEHLFYESELIVYDHGSNQFLRFEWEMAAGEEAGRPVVTMSEVFAGPEIPSEIAPIGLGILNGDAGVNIYFMEPASEKQEVIREIHGKERVAVERARLDTGIVHASYPYLCVLDESGFVYLVDRESLEIVKKAGWLPSPPTLFGSPPRGTIAAPRDVLAYNMMPMCKYRDPNVIETAEYLGLFTAAVSRDGHSMEMAVFDAEGKLVKSEFPMSRWGSQIFQSSRDKVVDSLIYGAPFGGLRMFGKFMLENLQPIGWSVASYATAETSEAGAGFRSLFLWPNSFVAMWARSAEENYLFKCGRVGLLIFPSMVLAGLMSSHVGKSAERIGLENKARVCWCIGVILFGLPAYITYFITRPRWGMVTCRNCGELRRVDTQRCHHCRAKWDLGHLEAPVWRVVDEERMIGTSRTEKQLAE